MKRFVKVEDTDIRYKGYGAWGSNAFDSSNNHGNCQLPEGYVVIAGIVANQNKFVVRFPYLGSIELYFGPGTRVSQPNPDGWSSGQSNVKWFSPVPNLTLITDGPNCRIKIGTLHFRGQPDGFRDDPMRDYYIFDTGYELRDV